MNVGLSILFVLIGAMLALAWASPLLIQAREHRTQPAPRPQPDRHGDDRGHARRARQFVNRRARTTYRGKSNKRQPGKPRPSFAHKRRRARKRGN